MFDFPQTDAGPKILLQALPDPNLEINDDLLRKSVDSRIDFSISIKHNDKALNADADEAIPLL